MKNKVAVVMLAIVVSLVLSTLVGFYLFKTKPAAWVELPKVFNDFEYKKELEKNYIKSEEARKKILDSLELELQVMYKGFELKRDKEIPETTKAEFQVKRENFLRKKEQFQQDDAQMKSEFNSQIYKQLSQYVKDYGKEKGYSIVLGAEGSGVILYGNEENNITEEVLQYINNKYKGIAK